MARWMKPSNSLPHSVMIACFSWLLVLHRRRWQTVCWRAPQTAQSTGFKSGLFGVHIKAPWTRRSHAAGTSVCSRQCVTARRPAANIRARCQRYSCRMWQLLWTITETINTLFLVVSLLPCVCVVTEVVLFAIVTFKRLDILQGSVATHRRCGGIFSDSIITSFLLILKVK